MKYKIGDKLKSKIQGKLDLTVIGFKANYIEVRWNYLSNSYTAWTDEKDLEDVLLYRRIVPTHLPDFL